MKRGKRMHGRILAVWEEQLGTTLSSDALAGATVLFVDDVSAFNDDDEGGWLQVGDQVVEYTTVDDDASTITLATALTTAVMADGDEPEVWVWNDLYDQLDTVQMAQVMPDGKRDQADAIEAVVSDLVTGLANSDRGRPRESCLLERDGDEWEVIRVKGRPSKARNGGGDKEFFQDYFTLGQDGVQGIELTYEPVEHSEHLYWNGLYQRQVVNWERDGRIISLLDTPVPPRAGDRVSVEYAYRPAVIQTPVIPDVESPPYTEDQLAQGVIIPISGTVSAMATGAGGVHGATSVSGATVWAPDNAGFATVGTYAHPDALFSGYATGQPDLIPGLPVVAGAAEVHMIAMLKVDLPHLFETYDGVEWSQGGGGDPPRMLMVRTGTSGSASASGVGFQWNGWLMVPIDTGSLGTIYDGVRASSFRSSLRVYGGYIGVPQEPKRFAAQWVVREAALMVIPHSVITGA